MKYSVDEPRVSTSYKEKMDEKTEGTEIKEKDEIIARLKGTLKPVLSGHSKIDKTKILMTYGSLLKVEIIAECFLWNILQCF